MSNQIKKRTTITNEIFAELEKKYPIRGEKSGVCYAQDMDYVTLEVLFYENADFLCINWWYGRLSKER